MKKIKILRTLSTLSILGMMATPLTSCGTGDHKEDVEKCTVTFNCDEGATLSGDTTIKVNKNSKWSNISKPTINLKDEYTSLGWYKDNEPITDDFDITSDLIITAKTKKNYTPSTSFEWEYDSTNLTAKVKKYIFTTYDVILPTKVENDGEIYTVTSIGDEAFINTQITSIVIPATISIIGKKAFSGCNLSSATFLSEEKNWTLINNIDCLDWNVSDTSKNAKALMQGTDYYWHSGIGFVNDSWTNIISYANQGLEVLKAKYLNRFGIESFVGMQRKVMIDDYVCWVRVIDEEHDTIAAGEKQGQKAALTFQLDSRLYLNKSRVTCKWNTGQYNHDYTNSVLRKNLTGEGEGTLQWYANDEKTELSETRTAFQALPSELQSGIKLVTKEVGIYENGYKVKTYNDKLFPLTYNEKAEPGLYALKEGTRYKFWIDHTKNKDLIEKIDGVGATQNDYWLVSPATDWQGMVWVVHPDGQSIDERSIQDIYGVNFAFCI